MQMAGSLDIRHDDANEGLETAMKVDWQALGSLSVRAYKDKPFYEVKWRDATRTQRKRRLGRAWLEPDGEGGWRRRRGRVREGFLNERAAYSMMSQVIAEVEAQQQIAPTMREARFEDAVALWLEHLEFEKRAKPPPSTVTGRCWPGRRRVAAGSGARGSCAHSRGASSAR